MSKRVHIPEYEQESELMAGEELVGGPAFWFLHLCWWQEDLRALVERFGADPADVDALSDRLTDDDAPWPVFRVPFGGGHTAVVALRNFPDDSGIDYFVHHPEWGRLGHLGQMDGHDTGPGLSWKELTAIAADVPDGAEGLTDPAERFLTLLPMLGDIDTPHDAAAVVARALTQCGIPPEHAPHIAGKILDNSFWELPSWVVRDGSPVPVCGASASPRAIPLAQGITAGQARDLAEALSGERKA
ncbi:hypothetical protein OG883_19315 [Streptomyces sp. NBC_01142]|uniref:hypothetical protein n=1 Tax=Streptomyces sp. NBC_01142 TaxID=2975865 RepID=UPI00224DB6D2|nr:hypothetical protein [Streptomyces sp. NBC_01142]MCX4821995.1 hypothetical protein [Streptomyces sp. NBC_01142]